MMFTEGLDENALNWVKQGTELDQHPRSPLIQNLPLDLTSNLPLLQKSNFFISEKTVTPSKFHSALLSPSRYRSVLLGGPPSIYVDSEEDNESIASAPEGFYAHFSYASEGENDLDSNDSDLFERLKNYDDEVQSKFLRPLVRGLSKENLRVDVGVKAKRTTSRFGENADINSHSGEFIQNQEQNGLPISRGYSYEEFMTPSFQLGTPSAPPIIGNGREGSELLDVEDHVKEFGERMEVSPHLQTQEQGNNEQPPRTISTEEDTNLPSWETNVADQIPSFTTSVRSAWQTFIAYDACFRLCLDAWERNCKEAPEFLRDQCMVLRNAFGIQKFLLQPQGHIQMGGRPVDKSDGTCNMKERKVIGQIEVEVKRVRLLPQKGQLRATSSQRAIYMQVGAEYVRLVKSVVMNHINSLKSASSLAASEEALTCKFQLKSSNEGPDSGSSIFLKPGSGDSHVFYPENQADKVYIEVLDNDKINRGHTTIQISSLANDHRGDIIRWWPLYLEDHVFIGKVQLCISMSGTSENKISTKSGPVVETLIYDLVLETALRAQHFNRKNLHINGIWKWLLNEFSDFYGVSEAYTKLRYLSYVMYIATPTKQCLEFLYELLVPVVKFRSEKCLTRQERSILLGCEDHIKSLLATTFQNYKSLDELSPTGLTDLFGPILSSAAPALVPAVQIFTLLYDVLSHESQDIMRNYLLTAATKRCRRYMMETEEFISSNSESFLTDSMTISTAYHKMKTLCSNISKEIQADIKIHNQHILPISIDLPNIAASVYSRELCKRLKGFLTSCPPSKPSPHVMELLIATADFERDLDSWNTSPVHCGIVSRDIFHNYIMVWIQDTRLQLLDLCKDAEKMTPFGMSTHCDTSPFVEDMYDRIKDSLNEYEAVINRWPQYLLSLESIVADIERAIMKALEKQYSDILVSLRDGIPKIIEKQMQKLSRRQSTAASYILPNQLGTFLNSLKRILDVLHCKIENILKSWSSYLTDADGNPVFGEQMNAIIVMLRKKYKKYMESIVQKIIGNIQANRSTKLKRILEETKEAEGEADIQERMQVLCQQLTDTIRNIHNVFSSRIFVAICRQCWDRMGQIVLSFLESRKENRIWYRGSDYALGILDDIFASEMQTLLGNSLQDKDLDLPRSVVEARSILC